MTDQVQVMQKAVQVWREQFSHNSVRSVYTQQQLYIK